ncbi:MAG: TetR family transcriptional regulator [Alphaproteobacteria bacterium]|nr:TetR family transcriptional regulator [Alphaproteobacteria bacterium]MBT5389295.1 TetR family transcriptional regulator [Alphaproteobacteria bacterium]MBT5540490.1 TetR family transcriptional regulator [Alphaproteobacteria bacterium]MBT5654411.1 TetR family transcriptional regulator [Alphaproteobacteria bacterium]
MKDKILDAALTLVAREGWTDLSFQEIANLAEVPLAEVYEHFPQKSAFLLALNEKVDRFVLKQAEELSEESGITPRERLFDLSLTRLDALFPYKNALAHIYKDLWFDPLSVLTLAPGFMTSLEWMLQASGLGISDCYGKVRIKALGTIYFLSLKTWLEDDSEDTSKTMAFMDTQMTRAESLFPQIWKG